jgi:mono/diheme cytochrome c family protein
MSFFVTKTLLAVLFIAAGLTAALSMLTLMGKAERKMGVAALRNTHRAAGYTFAVLLFVLAILGLHYLSSAGDTLPLRGVLHWSAAALLVFVLALKLAVVRWFKQFLKFVPVMGMIVITLALVVATLSAVFFVVTGAPGGEESAAENVRAKAISNEPATALEPEKPDKPGTAEEQGGPGSASSVVEESSQETEPAPEADAVAGEQVFAKSCAGCHHSDSTDRKIGPGLAGLFERESIESSGLSVTPENVREQIVAPAGGMPAFRGFLSDEQLDDLVAFLQTL